MSDIFISYKREEQPAAKRLAVALQRYGWSVWWDPHLRAGEHFDDTIEEALRDAKCVIVLWSKLSVNSRYVRDEATYALDKGKLIPVAIEDAERPFRFAGLQTAQLRGWDGSDAFPGFLKLVEDIRSEIGSPPALAVEEERERGADAEPESREGARRIEANKTRSDMENQYDISLYYEHTRQRMRIRAAVGSLIGLIVLFFLIAAFRNPGQSGGWGDFASYQNHEANYICAVLTFLSSPLLGLLLKPNRSGWHGASVGAGLGGIYWTLRGLLAWPTESYIENADGFLAVILLAGMGGIVGWVVSKRWTEL